VLAFALIAVGLVVGMTGPAGRAWFEQRRAQRERPRARVIYLPSGACRLERRD